MASGYAALGKARRSIIGRQKKLNVFEGVLGTIGTIASFAGSQAKKADTAWSEYEAGYKELGGDVADISRAKFGEKGWLKSKFGGPSGEVQIGDTMYDRKQIQKAGGVLGSDIGATLDKDSRDRYIERTAPGRKVRGSYEATTDEVIAQKKKAMGGGTYRGPGGQIVNPNQFADLEKAYGGNLYGSTEDNLPSSIGYGQGEYQSYIEEQLVQKRKAMGSGQYRDPSGKSVSGPFESQFQDMEETYGDNLYGPNQRNLPESIGYGQKEYQSHQQDIQWEQNRNWRQKLQDAKRKELMQEGVQQNPYMPGSPWLPGGGEEYPPKMNLMDSYYENNRRRKQY